MPIWSNRNIACQQGKKKKNPRAWLKHSEWTRLQCWLALSHPHIGLPVCKHEEHFQKVSTTFPFQHPGTDKQPLPIGWGKKLQTLCFPIVLKPARAICRHTRHAGWHPWLQIAWQIRPLCPQLSVSNPREMAIEENGRQAGRAMSVSVRMRARACVQTAIVRRPISFAVGFLGLGLQPGSICCTFSVSFPFWAIWFISSVSLWLPGSLMTNHHTLFLSFQALKGTEENMKFVSNFASAKTFLG